mgnify:FL=1
MSTSKLELQNLIKDHPELYDVQPNIEQVFDIIQQALASEHTLYICGNGGSAADAEHIAGELLKGFTLKRPLSVDRRKRLNSACRDSSEAEYLKANLQQGLRAIALTGHVALSTAMANDVASDLIFAQQLNALGRSGDVLLCISTSGNAKNVNLFAAVARALDIKVVGLTGESGGALKSRADVMINVPAEETYKIQELHLPVYHCLCAMLEKAFFKK